MRNIGFNPELLKCGSQDVRSSAMGDKMNFFDALCRCNSTNGLLHVRNGEFAGLAVDIVAHHQSFRPAGRPAQHDRDKFAAEEMCDFASCVRRVLKGGVVTMDEEDDLLTL